MFWTKPKILQAIKKLHARGIDLSHNALAEKHQPLLSAAVYHFGSYRRAVMRAGINYDRVVRRPRWDKKAIVAEITQAHRQGVDLSWSVVTKRRDTLGRAAFAALQPRLFGSWQRALISAGLDPDRVNRYRAWDKATVLAEFRKREKSSAPLSSAALAREDPPLHSAAVRHFRSFDAALRQAKIDPATVVQRRRWTADDVVASLRDLRKSRRPTTEEAVRQTYPSLYSASLRYFETYAKARAAADPRKRA